MVFNKFNAFVEALGQKKHNLNGDVLKIMLTNVAPLPTNTVKGDITDIGAGNGYVAGGSQATANTYVQTAGVAKLVANDVVFTAALGPIGPFRYAVLYNDTATNKDLIGWWDYGAPVTLLDTQTFTVDLDQTNGVLTNN